MQLGTYEVHSCAILNFPPPFVFIEFCNSSDVPLCTPEACIQESNKVFDSTRLDHTGRIEHRPLPNSLGLNSLKSNLWICTRVGAQLWRMLQVYKDL